MARVEQAIYNILSNDADVIAVVGSKIYPSFVPQDKTLPAITYERVGTEREFAMLNDPGVSQARIEVTAISTSASTVGDLANKIRIALSRHIGSHASVVVKDIYIEDERQTYFVDLETYEIVMAYMVLHDEV